MISLPTELKRVMFDDDEHKPQLPFGHATACMVLEGGLPPHFGIVILPIFDTVL